MSNTSVSGSCSTMLFLDPHVLADRARSVVAVGINGMRIDVAVVHVERAAVPATTEMPVLLASMAWRNGAAVGIDAP